MTDQHETIKLLDQLIEAMKELNEMWANIEDWNENNLEPILNNAA